ncbi:MAG: alpha-galactosidase [Victivallaceae bacterium]|nr:alpha-galactosidase [Victivallaceae bacterium]
MTDYKTLLLGDIFTHKKINICYKDDLLSITNGLCKRIVDLSDDYSSTISLKNSDGTEFADKSESADFSFIGINMPTSTHKTEYKLSVVEVKLCKASIFDAEHVRINLTMTENIQSITFVRSYLIFSDMPIIAVENSIRSNVSSNIYWSHRDGLNDKRNYPPEFLESSADTIRLNKDITPVKAVEFQGRTDYTNDLVIEHMLAVGDINGNLLFCENSDSGMFLLQEAPPSSERRDFEAHDFRVTEDNMLFSCGWGIAPEELIPGKSFTSYRHLVGFYAKGEEQLILKRYLKQRFPQNPDKDFSIMVNPWGIGGFPELVNEQFILEEIKTSAAIGATHYQVDDGWQTGRALQEIVLNNRCVTPEFWTVSKPHLPHGFKNIHDASLKHGIELALWVAPSCNQEYRDWESMADILFGFYQQYGIRMFKIDAVMIRTKLAEENLEHLVKTLRERSAGKIIFNFDTTNGQRPGYFMFLEYGNIFLENRYVYGAGIGYHPEDTLNNLWTLSKYTRTQTLQIEIPAHEDVNHTFYSARSRMQPDLYSAEYWAAIALFANPLLWLAPSAISEQLIETYRKMMDLHLKYRERIFAGDIFPVGQEPNGSAITGFISHNDTEDSGMLLLFRELNGQKSIHCDIPQLGNRKYRFEKIYDSDVTTIKQGEGSRFHLRMERLGSFCLFEYK